MMGHNYVKLWWQRSNADVVVVFENITFQKLVAFK